MLVCASEMVKHAKSVDGFHDDTARPRMGCRNDLVCALSTMLDEKVQVGLCTLQSSRSIVVYINRPVLPDTQGVRIDAYYERFVVCVGTGVTVVASTVQLQSARRERGRNIAETV